MAVRGTRPKPHSLRVVEGTDKYPPTKFRPPELVPNAYEPIEKPEGLLQKQDELWDKYIARAYWLRWADGPKARMWCYFMARFIEDPDAMTAAQIGQLRYLGSELGFDPVSRARMAGDDGGKEAGLKKFS